MHSDGRLLMNQLSFPKQSQEDRRSWEPGLPALLLQGNVDVKDCLPFCFPLFVFPSGLGGPLIVTFVSFVTGLDE